MYIIGMKGIMRNTQVSEMSAFRLSSGSSWYRRQILGVNRTMGSVFQHQHEEES